MADEKKDKKDAAKAEPAPAAEDQKKKGHNPKVNKMTMAQIEKKIEEVQSSQGGLMSRYAKQLLRRRDLLKSK
ncbi:MAG: hypothetical protein MUQ00_16235 [Candidatus Aminicenantes bacterium]|nr:hypothetical protein [Candidatus Aminicenantes bacterium]